MALSMPLFMATYKVQKNNFKTVSYISFYAVQCRRKSALSILFLHSRSYITSSMDVLFVVARPGGAWP
jgi:hypothetical protein